MKKSKKQKKTYVLFVGSKLGYEVLSKIATEIDVKYVFIEKDHAHETIQYYEKIIKICEETEIAYALVNKELNIVKKTREINPDFILSFGYRRMIKKDVRDCAKEGSFGSHFAPLPRYRGFAPLNWVLINGEKSTAVNFFELVEDVDAGRIIKSKQVEITPEDDINTLFDKCISEFITLLKECIQQLENGTYSLTLQKECDATYTCSRNPEDGEIDWNKGTDEILNLIRGLTYPYPGAYTYLKGEKMFIWSARKSIIPKYEGIVCGKVIKIKENGIIVLTKDGAIEIDDVQLENMSRTQAHKVINSIRITLGR